VDAVYESILNWESFSVRIKENELEDLPKVLISLATSLRRR
jgi:hypothetical protein